jgi:hypothetical protein
MTYQPVVPASGNLGWAFLTRTREAQQAAFESSATVSRQTTYFRETIGSVQTAEDLVKDRRLLEVALGAFGLGDDIENKFFIRKVLEEGVGNDEAFANRLADKRYFAMAEAFGFDRSPPNIVLADFANRIIDQFRSRQFEVAVGDQDQDLRLALSLEREMSALSDRKLSERGAWFTIMGTPPLRRIFETALGLPPATGAIDIDKQLEIFRDKSLKSFGTSNPSDFSDPDRQEDLIRRFLLRSDLAGFSSGTVKGSVALSLLSAQSAGLGAPR